MWTGIKNTIEHAIDGNTEAINHIASGERRTQESRSAAAVLTRQELKRIRRRADRNDIALRALLLAIQNEVELEKEAHP